MDAFCLDLSVCERHYSVFHEDKWWIVYCFADPEHAEKFRIRFGGERSATGSTMSVLDQSAD
jgi:hypothetical protein